MTVRPVDNERISALPNTERSCFSDTANMGVPQKIPRAVRHVVTFKAAGFARYIANACCARATGTEKDINMPESMSAERFVERLEAYRSPEEAKKLQRYFKHDEGDVFMGVRMRHVFALAKAFIDMPPEEIETLLESPIHEVRAGALSIMDKQARRKKTPERRRKELFELYLRRHDRINNWDLVDLGAPYVVGGYLFDKPRDLLYELARSKNIWERRTAIVSTAYFIRAGDVTDTFAIAEILLNDDQDLIHKAIGGWLREAGKKDRQQLLSFLDHHAATMPRVALRYAIEHLDQEQRAYYLSMKQVR